MSPNCRASALQVGRQFGDGTLGLRQTNHCGGLPQADAEHVAFDADRRAVNHSFSVM